MPLVLQMTKRLTQQPILPQVPGILLRHYAGPRDVEAWLEVRRRAFARQKVGISDWDAGDFQREFLSKPWWRPEAMWLAGSRPLVVPPSVVGSVTLARRGEAPHDKPVVHWMCVLPSYRRRGVGRLLLATLEAAVWEAGERQIWLETHSAWREALRLYESAGYQAADA
jgi:GNAT superfamily N-acetyltransferase